MVKIYLLILVVLFHHNGCAQISESTKCGSKISGILKKLKIKGPLSNDLIEFNLYLPPGYDSIGHNIPLGIWLHGLGGDHNSSTYLIEAYEDAYSDQVVGAMAILFPNGHVNSMWADSRSGKKMIETNVIHEILPYVEDNYKVSRNRGNHIVMGFSMGGFGAVEYAVKFPYLFGTAISFDGAFHNWRSINGSIGVVNEIFNRDHTHWKQFNPYDNLIKNADLVRSNVKLRFYVGELVEYNERFKQFMDAENIKYDYIVTSCSHDMNCLLRGYATDFFKYINSITSGATD